MAFEELKEVQGVVWGSGPYERISAHLTPAHDHLMRALPPREGEQWLDVATGTGEIASLAAEAGASVTGVDLAPDLIETARQLAQANGQSIEFDVGDAESLSYPDASFDTVTSSFGAMFTPDQAATAAELARVCKPGGRLGLLTWHPSKGVAEWFKLMKPYNKPAPAGAGNPFEWGSHDRLKELLGDHFELSFADGDAPQVNASGEEAWELFVNSYGPTKALADSLDDAQRQNLFRDWVAFFEGHRVNGKVSASRPYVLTIGTRR
jgi:SAM-dependent methyltransferase